MKKTLNTTEHGFDKSVEAQAVIQKSYERVGRPDEVKFGHGGGQRSKMQLITNISKAWALQCVIYVLIYFFGVEFQICIFIKKKNIYTGQIINQIQTWHHRPALRSKPKVFGSYISVQLMLI